MKRLPSSPEQTPFQITLPIREIVAEAVRQIRPRLFPYWISLKLACRLKGVPYSDVVSDKDQQPLLGFNQFDPTHPYGRGKRWSRAEIKIWMRHGKGDPEYIVYAKSRILELQRQAERMRQSA